MREHTLPEQPVVPVIPPRRIIATVDALPQCAHVLTFPDTSSTGRFAKPRAASEKSDPSPTGLRPTSRIVFAGIGWFASIATDSRSCRRTAASKSLRDRRPCKRASQKARTVVEGQHLVALDWPTTLVRIPQHGTAREAGHHAPRECSIASA